MKIAIVGSCGSGKTTLAKQLHKSIQLPLYLLDDYYWETGFKESTKAKFRRIHDDLCNKPEWIIEGMFTGNLEYRIQKADVVIFLNPPIYICVYRIFKRSLLNVLKSIERSHMLGCLKYTWKFNREKRFIVDTLFDKYKDSKKIFVIQDASELKNVMF